MVHVRHQRTAAWAAAAVLILVPAAAGCSDDNGGGSKATPTATALPSSSAPAANGPADPAAAKAEIEKNWTTFFDPKAATDAKVKVLENGALLRPLLAAFGGDKNAAQTSVKVTDVQFTSPTEATVTYDLLVAACAYPARHQGRGRLPGPDLEGLREDPVRPGQAQRQCGRAGLLKACCSRPS